MKQKSFFSKPSNWLSCRSIDSTYKQSTTKKSEVFLKDMSNPFKAFPKTIPHACLNKSQSVYEEYWTMICVHNPEVHDISRALLDSEWESWLTNHIVHAMMNYPNAVLLGKYDHNQHFHGILLIIIETLVPMLVLIASQLLQWRGR